MVTDWGDLLETALPPIMFGFLGAMLCAIFAWYQARREIVKEIAAQKKRNQEDYKREQSKIAHDPHKIMRLLMRDLNHWAWFVTEEDVEALVENDYPDALDFYYARLQLLEMYKTPYMAHQAYLRSTPKDWGSSNTVTG